MSSSQIHVFSSRSCYLISTPTQKSSTVWRISHDRSQTRIRGPGSRGLANALHSKYFIVYPLFIFLIINNYTRLIYNYAVNQLAIRYLGKEYFAVILRKHFAGTSVSLVRSNAQRQQIPSVSLHWMPSMDIQSFILLGVCRGVRLTGRSIPASPDFILRLNPMIFQKVRRKFSDRKAYSMGLTQLLR